MWLVGIRPLGLAALSGVLFLACPAAGADQAGPSLLDRFHAAFGPERPGWKNAAPADDAGRCGTPLIREYLSRRDGLPATIRQTIDGYLAALDQTDTLLSAGGHFRLTYLRDGDNAVPPADTSPADGVPDFVAEVADHLETAWAVEIGEVGLRAPPAGAPVDVSFRRMHFYGYTVPVDPDAGTTRLVLHNAFTRFPPNDDPDGDAAGAAKVTCAHELRHVSQYVGSRWSEGGWTELDATWAEERVYGQVNDYHHYLLGDSPVRRPEVPLDGGLTGTGSYDDAVFEIWLNRRWGDGLIRDYWEHRASAPDEEPLAAWDAVLAPRGVTLANAWSDFIGWNHATGARAIAGVGYPDAADYPAGEPAAAFDAFPAQTTGAVEHLAAVPVRLSGFEALGDRLLQLTFDGEDVPDPLTLALLVQTVEGGGYLEMVGLDRSNDARLVLRTPANALREVGVIIGNGAAAGPARFWTLAVDTVPGPPAPPAGRLAGVEPNPCNPATWVTCEMTARADATLDIVDAGGRRVRRLWAGSLGPGSYRFPWDGRADSGRPAPAGVYVARLGLAGTWQGRKLTLVR